MNQCLTEFGFAREHGCKVIGPKENKENLQYV